MLKVNRRLDYGLTLMIALANEAEGKAQPTSVLAEKLQIPLPFLHQIGHALMQAKLIKASPGPHGGIRLSRAAKDITVLDIPAIMETAPSLRVVNDEQQARSRVTEMLSAGKPASNVACLAGTSVSRATSARTQLP